MTFYEANDFIRSCGCGPRAYGGTSFGSAVGYLILALLPLYTHVRSVIGSGGERSYILHDEFCVEAHGRRIPGGIIRDRSDMGCPDASDLVLTHLPARR